MAKRKSQQVRGRKEAPLAVVGNVDVEQLQNERDISLTPEEPAFHYFRELLQGYFEKLTRWTSILDDVVSNCILDIFPDIDPLYRKFAVRQTAEGLAISPVRGEEYLHDKEQPNTVLYMSGGYVENREDKQHKKIHIYPGEAGRHLLIDPKGRPIEELEISIEDQTVGWKGKSPDYRDQILSIKQCFYDRRGKTTILNTIGSVMYGVMFENNQTTLTVIRSFTEPMSDIYATALLDTVDKLIPRTFVTEPPPERTVSQEKQPQKALQPARRRPRQ